MRFNVPEEFRNQSGIYIITNDIDQRVYIGQAINFYKRYLSHRSLLRTGRHGNPLLQSFADEVTIDKLVFGLLEVCKRNSLYSKEGEYIKKYKSVFDGYGFNLATSCMEIPTDVEGCKLNSLVSFISNKSYKYEVDRCSSLVEQYRGHFKNIASSNMNMAEEMDKLEQRANLFKERCQLLEEELVLLKDKVLRKKIVPVAPQTNQLSLFS